LRGIGGEVLLFALIRVHSRLNAFAFDCAIIKLAMNTTGKSWHVRPRRYLAVLPSRVRANLFGD